MTCRDVDSLCSGDISQETDVEAEKDNGEVEGMAVLVAEVKDVEVDDKLGDEEEIVLVVILVCHVKNVDAEVIFGDWDEEDGHQDLLHDLFLLIEKILED